MKARDRNLIIAAIGLVVLALIFFFLRGEEYMKLKYFLAVIGLFVIVLPFVLTTVLNSTKLKEKETQFLAFVRDLVENVKSGTPVGKAILNVKNREYGALTPHIKKLANQLSLGIPLNTCLINFAKDTKSKVISRAVSLISEAEKSGGEIDVILNSVANSVNQIEQLRKEQKSAVYNLVVQGYIIFLVFIMIVLSLQYYILPLTEGIGGVSDLNVQIQLNTNVDLGKPLLGLLVVQSFFAGIVIGKISEGNFKDGMKHSFILVTLTLLISSGAALIL